MSTHEPSIPDSSRASAEELLAHAVWLRRLARSLVADAATADDLVQDAWIAAMRKPPRSDQPIAPWLARVVRNLAHNRRRSEQRRATREASTFVHHHEPGSDETASSLEMQRMLIDAVESLGEPSRSTILRHYFHAKTSVEIAREDGVAEGTVRWRMTAAIDELKKRLDTRHDGDRRAWSALLLPIARRADVAAMTSTITAGTATGVILMSTWLKIVIAALIVAISVCGWLITRTPDPVAPPVVAANAPSSPREIEAPSAVDPATEVPVREALPLAASNAVVAASPATTPAAKPDYTAYVEARVLAGVNLPIADALVTCVDNVLADGTGRDAAPKSKTGQDGRVRMALKKSDMSRRRGRSVAAAPDTWLIELEFTAAGKAALRKEVNVKADNTYSLGDVVLADGGDITGRTVDASGNAVEGADVYLIQPDLTLEERDAVAAKGLDSKRSATRMKSKADGSFAVLALPLGKYRIWSKPSGRLGAVSDVFEVAAGQTATVHDLVLPENAAAIRGVLLGLDGAPVRRGQVEYTLTESGNEFWASLSTNDKGEFVIDEVTTPTIDVYAIGPWSKGDGLDPKEQRDRGQAIVNGVKSGTHDLVLRLAPTPLTRVTVKDKTGAIVDPIDVSVYDLRGNGGGGTANGPVHAVRLLAKPCQIVVSGPGYAKSTVGPFGLGRMPATLDIVVERRALVSGRVTLDGKPPDRAGVYARRVLPAGTQNTHNGFALRLDTNGDVGASVDKDGLFAFSVEEEGQWVILVLQRGCALWESEPFALGPDHGKEGIEIALGHGGAVEGRVTSMTTSDLEPAYVTLSRGTGRDASARIQADGTFRVENLTPGTWQIGMTREDHSDGGWTLENMPSDPAVREVTIVEGKTAHIDLDAHAFTSPKIAGRLAMKGVDTRQWSAVLGVKSSPYYRGSAATVDANGSFSLVADEVGPHHLTLSCSSGDARSDTIECDVDLAHGTLDWSFEFETGSVKLPTSAAGDIVMTWKAPNGVSWSARMRKSAGSELVVDHIPAGSVSVKVDGGSDASLLVRAGEVSAFELR